MPNIPLRRYVTYDVEGHSLLIRSFEVIEERTMSAYLDRFNSLEMWSRRLGEKPPDQPVVEVNADVDLRDGWKLVNGRIVKGEDYVPF